jgi:hypothetical protein
MLLRAHQSTTVHSGIPASLLFYLRFETGIFNPYPEPAPDVKTSAPDMKTAAPDMKTARQDEQPWPPTDEGGGRPRAVVNWT